MDFIRLTGIGFVWQQKLTGQPQLIRHKFEILRGGMKKGFFFCVANVNHLP